MIPFVLLIFLVITITYSYLIIKFTIGWRKLDDFSEDTTYEAKTVVTIICPFKNEIAHLPYLFQAVAEQTYQNFEMLLIDDGSTDGSRAYAEEVVLSFDNFKVIKNNGKGKKEAIRTGVKAAQNEILITLDADCIPDIDWLVNIVQYYEKKKSDLLILPVKIESDNTWFSDFQQVEFMSLVASGGGAASANMPILCNGANLCFTKSAWLASEEELHFEEVSGDDIYLLQSIKRQKGKIDFLKSKATIGITQPKKKLADFLHQRTRWASKKSALKDRDYLFTSSIVFLMSFIIVISLICSLFNAIFAGVFLGLFLTKLVIDTVFFYQIKAFFDVEKMLLKSVIFSIVYPFYIVITSISSLFSKGKW